MDQTFSGQNNILFSDVTKESYLTERHQLVYYGGYTLQDIYIMPIKHRRFFLKLIQKDMMAGKEDSNNPQPNSKAMQHNTPMIRSLQGKDRHYIPKRNIRLGD